MFNLFNVFPLFFCMKGKARLMANLLGENRFFISLKNLSKLARFLITLSILLSPLFFWFFSFYLPLDLKMYKENQMIKSNLEQNKIFNNILLSFDDIKNKNAYILKELKGHSFDKNNLKEKLDYILFALNKNNLNYIEFKPLDKKFFNFYKKEYFSLKIQGGFFKIISFLEDLEKIKEFVKIKDLELFKIKCGDILLFMKLRGVIFIV